jgi:HK97 family phage prohead protease
MAACVPVAIAEGKDQDQAVAMCAAMWEDKGKKAKPEPKLEYKSFPLDIQSIEGRTVKSLFAVMGHVDDGGDRILPKAFARTLSQRMDRVRVLWQHNANDAPIGKPLVLKEISTNELPAEYKTQYPAATGALYGEIEFVDTDRGNEIFTCIRAGAIKENSIGYDTLQYDYSNESKRKVRNLKELRLWDISPVNWGMQPAAINLKSLIDQFKIGELKTEDFIRGYYRILTGERKEGRVFSASNLAEINAVIEEFTHAAERLKALILAPDPSKDEVFIKTLTAKLQAQIAIREKELY